MSVTYSKFLHDLRFYHLSCKEDSLKAFHYSNGCGSKGGFKFPSTMWGVNIEVACAIHDIEWQLAKNFSDIVDANENFDNNLKKICDAESNFVMKPVRRMRIAKYVTGVELYGTDTYARERGFIR